MLENSDPSGEPCLKRHALLNEADSYWSARLARAGKNYCERFADADYGGKAGALNAAKAWRDHMTPAVQRKPRPSKTRTPLLVAIPQVDPHRLLDAALQKLDLKDDIALSFVLGVSPVVISRPRNNRIALDQATLRHILDAAQMNEVHLP